MNNLEILSQIVESKRRNLIKDYQYQTDIFTNLPTRISIYFLETTPTHTKIALQDYFLEEHNIHTIIMGDGGSMQIQLEVRLWTSPHQNRSSSSLT